MYGKPWGILAIAGLLIGAGSILAQQTSNQNTNEQNAAEQSNAQQPPYLGIAVREGADAQQSGVVVHSVSPNSPAQQAGVKPGDIITKVGDKTVQGPEELTNLVHQHKVGDQLGLQVMRNGQPQTLTVTLQKEPADFGRQRGETGPEQNESAQDNQGDRGRNPMFPERFGMGDQGQRGARTFLGVQTRELTDEMKTQRGGSADKGLLITDVVPDSPAAGAGLKRNDVMTRIDGKEVSTPQQLRQVVRQKKPGDQVKIEIMRGKDHQELTARLEENSSAFGGTAPFGGWRSFEQNPNMPFGDQNQEIQRLERRVRDLEQRLQALEQNRQSGAPSNK